MSCALASRSSSRLEHRFHRGDRVRRGIGLPDQLDQVARRRIAHPEAREAHHVRAFLAARFARVGAQALRAEL
jgi:hypothetical protein